MDWQATFVEHLIPLSLLQLVQSYDVPTQKFTFTWGIIEMPVSGRLVTGRGHGHGAVNNHQFLFAASPEQLGLHKIGAPGRFSAGRTIVHLTDLDSTGLPSLLHLKKYVFRHLQEAVEAYNSADSGTNDSTRPKLICERPGLQEEVDGFLYDRSIPADKQCSPWNFKKGDRVTALFFNQVLDQRSLGIELVRNRSSFPKSFLQHQLWFLYYHQYTTAVVPRSMSLELSQP